VGRVAWLRPSPQVTPRPAPPRVESVRWLSSPRPGLAGLAAAKKEVVPSGQTADGFLSAAAAATAAGFAAAAARGAGFAEAAEAAEAVGEARVVGVAGEEADPGVVDRAGGAGVAPPPLLWR